MKAVAISDMGAWLLVFAADAIGAAQEGIARQRNSLTEPLDGRRRAPARPYTFRINRRR